MLAQYISFYTKNIIYPHSVWRFDEKYRKKDADTSEEKLNIK